MSLGFPETVDYSFMTVRKRTPTKIHTREFWASKSCFQTQYRYHARALDNLTAL